MSARNTNTRVKFRYSLYTTHGGGGPYSGAYQFEQHHDEKTDDSDLNDDENDEKDDEKDMEEVTDDSDNKKVSLGVVQLYFG